MNKKEYIIPIARLHELRPLRLLSDSDPSRTDTEGEDNHYEKAKESSFSFDDDDINEEW